MNFSNLPRIVILTGAGISAESGLKTFRESGGLWEEYDIMDVATPEGWLNNRELVLRFYNERRRQLDTVVPNEAHKAILLLYKHFDVDIITQNVDDLHERAGSTKVMHLHGELRKARSEKYPNLVYDIGTKDINNEDTCERGEQLRPDIVWFGEDVPLIPLAAAIVSKADILIVIGTSLNVYPAAGLLYNAPYECRKYLVDPNDSINNVFNLEHIKAKAGTAMPVLVERLIKERLEVRS